MDKSAHGPARVLVLIKELEVGGAEMLLVKALSFLDRRRFDYRFAWLEGPGTLAGPLREAGFPALDLSRRGRLDPAVPWRLARLIRQGGIDLVHSHLPFTAVLARPVCRLLGTPHVYTEHNVVDCYRPATRLADRFTWGLDRRLVAVSEAVARSVRGTLAPPVTVIRNGVDFSKLAPRPGSAERLRRELNLDPQAEVVLSVANLLPKKGHRYLMEAFAEVARERPGAVLLLAGEGPEREGLEEQARRLGLTDRVRLPGRRDDVPDLLALADLFVLSSLVEGLPVALLEAMALGRAAVATRVGGSPEALEEGRTGRLVPPRDPAALARAILDLLADKNLRERMGRAAREKALREFGLEQMVRRVEAVYAEALNGGR